MSNKLDKRILYEMTGKRVNTGDYLDESSESETESEED